MKPLKLSSETILAARDYVPLEENQRFVEACADRCFDTPNGHTGDAGGEDEVLPPLSKENNGRKARCMMAALANLYLNLDVKSEPDFPWMVTAAEYDRLAASHVQNQLERAKHDLTLREKAFDLLGDYKDLERRLNAEIHALAAVMNDPASRLLAAMNQAASGAMLEGAKETFRAAMEELGARKNAEGAGDGNG